MKHPTYRLDQDAAAAIRRDRAAGRAVAALAREHGVSLPTVRAVLRYARYRPALSEQQQRQLSDLSQRLGCTRDEILARVFTGGVNEVLRTPSRGKDHE
jgi:hypothetical protein